jgi:hypothetical protein
MKVQAQEASTRNALTIVRIITVSGVTALQNTPAKNVRNSLRRYTGHCRWRNTYLFPVSQEHQFGTTFLIPGKLQVRSLEDHQLSLETGMAS